MNKFLMSVAALCLILAAPAAVAQPDQRDQKSQSGGASNRGAEHSSVRPPSGGGRPERSQAAPNRPATSRPAMTRPTCPTVNRPRSSVRSETHNRPAASHNLTNQNRASTNRSDVNRPGANRQNISSLRRTYTAPRRYRAGTYRPPAGYHYQHWSYGQRLPTAYFARNYWLLDWATYGLISPPYGYVWVRVGPDALLIDQYTGEVVQVSYNAFY